MSSLPPRRVAFAPEVSAAEASRRGGNDENINTPRRFQRPTEHVANVTLTVATLLGSIDDYCNMPRKYRPRHSRSALKSQWALRFAAAPVWPCVADRSSSRLDIIRSVWCARRADRHGRLFKRILRVSDSSRVSECSRNTDCDACRCHLLTKTIWRFDAKLLVGDSISETSIRSRFP